ncbi:uncharacterized protein BX664DRAFT_380965 [Halteromyces radiatus]|uniref:uncharacterized protein n=1 Tax=Halteromyces radiatus TaxID=101107 RepID=UPI002220C4A2|nr:uncharacterized protein BX664DRAFT_380965 [Halteromyces radiatus]KAI8078836.1 hypothetical protein BX664DRAFT_380965 [Halteromyces radiatus]
MTFGNDLQDQIPAINDYVGEGLQSLNQFRNFVRDKSHLEREYAQKMEHLAKKYKTAKKQTLDTTTISTNDDMEWDDSTSTSALAWHSLLHQTELLAKSRYQLVEDLNNSITEPAKATMTRKEEAKKKHIAFFHKLKSERDKTYLDKDKAKQAYDDACSEIESVRIKLNKPTGDNEKLQRQLDHAILECNNKKNSYLLALAVANAERTKYFEVDIPSLADNLQDLDATRVLAMRDLYAKYVNIELQALAKSQNYYDTAMMDISKMDPEVDENLFVRDALGSTTNNNNNTEFTFLPWTGASIDSTTIDTDDSLVISDSSIIFLNNKLVKDRKRLDTIGDELSKRSKDLADMDTYVRSITDKAQPEYDVAREQLMDLSREMTILATQKARVKSEIDVIIHCIGDDGLSAQIHDFKPSSFTIPTTCDYCKSTIWGLSKQGMTCKVCGFNCHAKCEMKVAPNCSGVRGKINQQPSSSNISIMSSAPRHSTSSNRSFLSTTPTTPITATMPTTTTTSTSLLEALYYYEAQNDDELTIMEGDRLTIVEDSGDGWIKVRRGNDIGVIPANYVGPVTTSQEDNNDHSLETTCHDSTPDTVEQPITETTPDYVVALYDFQAVNADELNLREGDTILVTKRDDSGWWEGVLNGTPGIFPANYVGTK